MAPIDPAHLLKALDPLLFDEGGIKEVSASQFASLMKKFSKKLVSRCVYTNVLAVTKSDVLEKVLDQGGWCTINAWLVDAKQSNHQSFLLKLLTLCKLLPMTIERLKENNTPKIVKSLTKFENDRIVSLSNELVSKWMTIIKGESATVHVPKKKKKLKVPKESNKEQKDPEKSVKNEIKEKNELKEKSEIKEKNEVKKEEKPAKELLRPAARVRGSKRISSEKTVPTENLYEDVKIELKCEPLPKKPKVDRPKTVKSYTGKFRATGLEEAAPLPKKISKKTPTVDKNAAAAVAKNAVVKRLNTTLPERITEKKIKPENLLNINETVPPSGGIKLIPAKPRPTHILHESASFMDALVAPPAPPIKRKKKPAPKPTTPPTSPPIKPLKLQFYKDTLEMNTEESSTTEEEKKKDEQGESNEAKPESPSKSELNENDSKEVTSEEKPVVPTTDTEIAEESINKAMEKEKEEASAKEVENSQEQEDTETTEPGQLRSILSHGRKKRKKNVKWVDDENLKEMFYFELDETERVNVLRSRPFGDLKTLEARREREAFEAAKRQAGDKMEEMIPWWTIPIYVDVPPPLVEPGSLSQEKEIQRLRQQSVLQAIYFSRDSVPDSPQEPDSEIVVPQETKIIPLDEENMVGSMLDYSSQQMPAPKASLPEVLSSLMNIPLSRSLQTQSSHMDQGLPVNSMMLPLNTPTSPTSPYDPGEPVPQMLPSIPPQQPQQQQQQPPPTPPVMFNAPGPMVDAEMPMPMANNWSPIESNMVPPDHFFPGMFPGVGPYPIMDPGIPHANMRPMRVRMMNPMNKTGPYPRMGGPRRGPPRIPCRHFLAGGCRFGNKCSFLHPGINGRPL